MADNSLALGIRPIATPDYAGTTMNRVNMMANLAKMEQYKREVGQQNALAQVMQMPGGFDPTDQAQVANLYRVAPTLAPEFVKTMLDTRSAGSNATAAADKAVGERLNLSSQVLDIINPDAPDAAQRFLAWHEANHDDPLIGPMLARTGVGRADARASIDAAVAQGPQALRNLILQARMGLDKFMIANKPTITSQNFGGGRVLMTTPGLGGDATVVPGSYIANTMTPEQQYNAANPNRTAIQTTEGIFAFDPKAGTATPVTRGAASSGVPGARAPSAAAVPSIVQNNNPGALEFRPWMAKYGGTVSSDGRFAQFPTSEQGVAAQEALLRNDYVGKGVNTINAVVDKYLGTGAENSPASRANYKAVVSGLLGIAPNAQLSPSQVPVLAQAMRSFETGASGAAPSVAAPTGATDGGRLMPYVPPKVPTETQLAAEKAKVAARENFSALLGDVRAAYEALDKLGALTSSTKGTLGRNLMASAGASGPGQFLSGALGTKAQTERDTIANAQFTLLNQIKNMEGIGARSLDSNVELKNALASLGKPGQSIETVRRTLASIGRIYKAATGEDLAGGRAPPSPPARNAPSGWGKAKVVGN